MSKEILKAAQNYLSKGYSVIPIKKGQKKPDLKSWDPYQDRLATQEELTAWFDNDLDRQVGVVTGCVSGGLFILDFDGEDCVRIADEFLNEFREFRDSLCVFTGGGRLHIWGKCPGMRRTMTKVDRKFPGGQIELRVNDMQTLVPPSIHPSGNDYRFVDESKQPVEISMERLTDIEIWMSKGQTAEQPREKQEQSINWVDELKNRVICRGERDDTATKLAGYYINKGLTRDEVISILLAFNWEGGDFSIGDISKCVDSIAEKDARNPKAEQTHKYVISDYDLKSFREVWDMPNIEKQWIWDGVLPKGGLSLVGAKSKVGKSTFAINLAMCVAQGVPFLNIPTMQGKVIYLALEEHQGQLIGTMKQAGLQPVDDFYFHFGMAPQEALLKLIPQIEKIQPTLVVIDIMQKFLRIKEGQYEEVIAKFEPVIDVARKFNCHILLTTHAPKGERELVDMFIGSTGYAASVDTLVIIKKDYPEQRRILSTVQRYHKIGGADIENQVLVLNADGFTLSIGGTLQEIEKRNVKAQILATLRQIRPGMFNAEPMTERQIRDAIGRSQNITSICLRELFDAHEIQRTGTGRSGRNGNPYRYFVEE